MRYLCRPGFAFGHRHIAGGVFCWLQYFGSQPAVYRIKSGADGFERHSHMYNMAQSIGVRNLAPSVWQSCEEWLLAVLQQFEGVEAASLSADRSTVYIKARQQGFDEAAAKQIILGGNHVE